MNAFFTLSLVSAAACCLSSCAVSPVVQGPRPETWAAPLEVAGVPNLHRVSRNVYRSAQPTAEGMKNLETMGIRTVVNLRYFHSDADEIQHTRLRGVKQGHLTWSLNRAHVEPLLDLLADPGQGPVLIHCQHGADRTGSMCALYRTRIQGWTPEEAVREMQQGGYGFHSIWGHLPAWVHEHSRPKETGRPVTGAPGH